MNNILAPVPKKYPNLTLTDQIPINHVIDGKLYLKLAISIHCLHCASVVIRIVHHALFTQDQLPLITPGSGRCVTVKLAVTVKNV